MAKGTSSMIRRLFALLSCLSLTVRTSNGFSQGPDNNRKLTYVLKLRTKNLAYSSQRKSATTRRTALDMSSNQFDVSKPVFDLLSARSVRGDAIVRYESLNQSEPLRINLYGLLTLVLLAAPSLSEALDFNEFGLIGTSASILGSFLSLCLFLRECQRRSKQLTRIEKELNAEYLMLRLPTNAIADMPFTKPASLGTLKSLSNPPRIISLCGTASQLKEALKSLSVFGRRLQQATTYVVPVPTDGSSRSDWGVEDKLLWLAEPSDVQSWKAYFDELSSTASFRWFGLNSTGRSFGSGAGEKPQWLQILGQHLRPTDILDTSDKDIVGSDDVSKVLDAQHNFYTALTSGKLEDMKRVFSDKASEQVTEVLDAGGRIDDWSSCLADGARPAGMTISGSDVCLVSDSEAVSTVVEFPADTGIDTATLLAVQQWRRDSTKNEWKLELHQTIPWSTDTKAQGTLRCDCRGCVALTRGDERRTFGGLIG